MLDVQLIFFRERPIVGKPIHWHAKMPFLDVAMGKYVKQPIDIRKSILEKMPGQLHGIFLGNLMRGNGCRNRIDTGHTLFSLPFVSLWQYK